MTIQRYQYIIKVADVSSITEAARQLYVSPSAISQCIAAEEKEHNIQIFDRTSKPIQLTTQGKIYLQFAQEMIHCYKNMSIKLQEDMLYHNEFTLTIAIPAVLVKDFFAAISPKFQQRFPKSHFRVISPSLKITESLLINKRIDFALTGWFYNSPKIINIELAQYPETLLVAPPQHPVVMRYAHLNSWNMRPVLDLHEIRHESFILAPPGDHLREIADFCFTKYGFIPEERIEISNSIAIQSLVELGLGLGFINAHQVIIADKSPIEYFYLDQAIQVPQRRLYLQHCQKDSLSPPIKYIMELFQQNYSKLQIR